MSKGWMWVLAIAGLVGVVWVCNSWVNYAEEEERQLAQLTGVSVPAVMTTASSPSPTIETSTLTDILVWQFCIHVLQGETTDAEVGTIYHLNEQGLRKDRDYALRVVRLLRQAIDQPNEQLKAITALDGVCREWQQEDARRAGWGN